MLSLFATLMPFSMCIVWSVVVLMRGRRHSSYPLKLLMTVMAVTALYVLSEANISYSGVNPRTLVFSDIAMRASSLALYPLVCFFIKSLADDSPVPLPAYLLLLPSFLIGTSTALIYAIMGLDNAALLLEGGMSEQLPAFDLILVRAHNVVSVSLFEMLLILSLISTFCYMLLSLIGNKFKFGHILGFLKGKPSLTANVACSIFVIFFLIFIARVYLGRPWLVGHQTCSSLLSLAMFLVIFSVGYVCVINPLPGGYINLDRLAHPFDAMRESRQEYIAKIDSGPVAAMRYGGMERLRDGIDRKLKEQFYLNPAVNIEDLARSLGTNRTYVSKYINLTYGMTFRDYLSKLRLDHAKQLMIDEPDAVLEYISSNSGFTTLSQFIRKFKEVEGVTPTVWRNSRKGR